MSKRVTLVPPVPQTKCQGPVLRGGGDLTIRILSERGFRSPKQLTSAPAQRVRSLPGRDHLGKVGGIIPGTLAPSLAPLYR